MSPRAPARRDGDDGCLGGAVLLGRRPRRRPGRRAAASVCVARPLRAAPRATRRARATTRRELPRSRRRESARRSRGRAASRPRLLRQEHDADHAGARLLGRARDARHRRRDRDDAAARPRLRPLHALHRRVPDGRARRAWSARRESVPVVLDAGSDRGAGEVPRGARRVGLRLRHLPGRVPVEQGYREAPGRRSSSRSTRHRTSRSSTGSRVPGTISSPSSIASTCRATTRAG